ncbi:MAG: hypothetical protein KAI47_05380 [Deltaproteobacteria bacterium]|nr:hypothetical protein [Deltaproteobacteria bacterium]
MECTLKGGVKGKPKIKRVSDGYIEYLKSGRRYTFSRWYPWTTWYIGLPPPKAKVVLKLVKENKLSFLGRSYDHGQIVSDLETVKLADKPRWTWKNPNELTVSVVGTYHRKKGGSEVAHMAHLKWVTLARDNMKAAWKYKGSSKTRKASDEKVLSVKKYSDAEYKKLKTIKEKAEDDTARAHLATLPKVEVPNFKTSDELVAFIWKMLRTATPKQLEAYLRKVYSPWHFVKGSTVALRDEPEKKMNAVIARALTGPSKFKDQYCTAPLKKERGSYWNKDKSTWARIATVPGPGKWVNGRKVPGTYKLSDLTVAILSGDKLARMNSYKKDKCPRKITAAEKALGVPKADGSGQWKIGDKVRCRYKGRKRWYSGKIDKINGTKIFIKYKDGDSEWTTASMLKSR